MSSSNTNRFGLKAALSVSVGFTALIAGTGLTATAQDEAEEGAKRLNTVTITATKREQTLQDVPVAVSVVDDSVIERAEILDLNDLQSVVPSLGFRTFQNSANANFTIRGFGNGANNVGIEPSVGIFVDGVFRSRAAAQIGDLPAIERVEVLRGPQSTLFGKNASAGVVSVVTKRPQYEFGGNVEASFGNLGLQRYKGYLTGPISDNLAFSIGGGINKRDGTATNLVNGEELNTRDRWNIRGDLLWEPTENQTWRLIADIDEIDEVCCIASNLITNAGTEAIINLSGGQLVAEDPFSRNVFLNGTPSNKLENRGISLQGDIEFDGFTVTTITSYRESDRDNFYDIDFTSGRFADLAEIVELETFTQEIRLTSNGDGNFDWMVGGFFFDESANVENELVFREDFRSFVDLGVAFAGASSQAEIDAIVGSVLGGTFQSPLAGLETLLGAPIGSFAANGTGNFERFTQDDQALSLFGTVDWHISDRLTATVGLNYTDNEKDATLSINATEPLSGIDLAQAGYNTIVGGALQGAGVDLTDPTAIGAFITNNAATYAGIQGLALNIASNFDSTAPGFNPLAPAPGQQNPFAGVRALQFQPPFLNFPNSVEDGTISADDVTYSLRLAYDLTDNINVYGSYATGWKSNSFNLSRDSRPFAADFTPAFDALTSLSSGTIVDPFTGQTVRTAPSSAIQDAGIAVNNLTTGTRFAEPEDAEVFELGLKGSWSNFALNVAIFEQTISDFQSNAFLGTGFVLANADEQSATGLELDLSWSPIENLTLNFAGTFLDPSFDSFPNGTVINADGTSSPADLTGATPSGISEVITSTSALYEFNVTNDWSGFFRADWQYEEDNAFFGDISPAEPIVAGVYSREVDLWNASLGFVSEGGLGITFWGRNIFDEEYITTAFPGVAQPGIFSGYPSQPRTYGVTLRKTF